MANGKYYAPEFKEQAVKMVVRPGLHLLPMHYLTISWLPDRL